MFSQNLKCKSGLCDAANLCAHDLGPCDAKLTVGALAIPTLNQNSLSVATFFTRFGHEH